MPAHLYIERTSLKGEPFVGTCQACGKQGITYKTMLEECSNNRQLTQEQALIEAIRGDITYND